MARNEPKKILDVVQCRRQGWLSGSQYFAICRTDDMVVIVPTGKVGLLRYPGLAPSEMWARGIEKVRPVAQALLGMTTDAVVAQYPASIVINNSDVRQVVVRDKPSSFGKMLEIRTPAKTHEFDALLSFDDIGPCRALFERVAPGHVSGN